MSTELQPSNEGSREALRGAREPRGYTITISIVPPEAIACTGPYDYTDDLTALLYSYARCVGPFSLLVKDNVGGWIQLCQEQPPGRADQDWQARHTEVTSFDVDIPLQESTHFFS